jgi:hypothetical protein
MTETVKQSIADPTHGTAMMNQHVGATSLVGSSHLNNTEIHNELINSSFEKSGETTPEYVEFGRKTNAINNDLVKGALGKPDGPKEISGAASRVCQPQSRASDSLWSTQILLYLRVNPSLVP